MERLNKRIVLAVLVATICLSVIASAIGIFKDAQKSDIAMVELDLGLPKSSKLDEPSEAAVQTPDMHQATELIGRPEHSAFQPQIPNSFHHGMGSGIGSSEKNIDRHLSSERPFASRIKPISVELRQVIGSAGSQKPSGAASVIETNNASSFRVSTPLPVVSSPPDSSTTPDKKSRRFKSFRLQPLPAAVVSTVMQKVDYANSLARRGAISTAELELHGALLAISESLDRQTSSKQYSLLVSDAFTAFREAEDFVNVVNDVDLLVAGHTTQILQSEKRRDLSGKQAAMIYFQHAESLLAKAFDGQPAASAALRSLGKLYGIANRFGDRDDNSTAKSMVMYRLATRLNPSDARALAELGVLYAKLNHLAEAKELLVQSLRIEPISSTWKSLASVHSGLGEQQLSLQAMRESQLSARARPVGVVNWTNPSTFNQVNAMVEPPVMAATHPTRSRNATPAPATQNRISGNGIGHFNWR